MDGVLATQDGGVVCVAYIKGNEAAKPATPALVKIIPGVRTSQHTAPATNPKMGTLAHAPALQYRASAPAPTVRVPPQPERSATLETERDDHIHSDGYAWKKYGSKGSVHPRLYYKCRASGCPAKKTEEKQENGACKASYKGTHNHTSPQYSCVSANTAEEFARVVAQHHERTWTPPTEDPEATRAGTRPRFVITLPVGIDGLNDGYAWKKYGQKKIKNRAFPRAYYQCIEPRCEMRKQVDRTPTGETVCTYECAHNHPPAPARPLSRVATFDSLLTGAGGVTTPLGAPPMMRLGVVRQRDEDGEDMDERNKRRKLADW